MLQWPLMLQCNGLQKWTPSDKTKHNQTKLDIIGPKWTKTDKSGQNLTKAELACFSPSTGIGLLAEGRTGYNIPNWFGWFYGGISRKGVLLVMIRKGPWASLWCPWRVPAGSSTAAQSQQLLCAYLTIPPLLLPIYIA